MLKTRTFIFSILSVTIIAVTALVTSCNSSDCPLTNTVMQKCGFYDSDGNVLTIDDTLTITVRDSVILNRLTEGTGVKLPMSYNAAQDTLVFHYIPTGEITEVTDTLVVSKKNTPHFVSLECARSMFHNITNVTWTTRKPDQTYRYAIERVAVANEHVNYDEKENLQIYFAVYH